MARKPKSKRLASRSTEEKAKVTDLSRAVQFGRDISCFSHYLKGIFPSCCTCMLSRAWGRNGKQTFSN